jgi:hypothetical protein
MITLAISLWQHVTGAGALGGGGTPGSADVAPGTMIMGH